MSDAERYAEGLTAIEAKAHPDSQYEFSVNPGRRYDKIVQRSTRWGNPSVHAFVEKDTGWVYKAATWAQPAKGARFATVDDALLAAQADPTAFAGGYLYR